MRRRLPPIFSMLRSEFEPCICALHGGHLLLLLPFDLPPWVTFFFPAFARRVISACPSFFRPAAAHTARGSEAPPFLATSATQRANAPGLLWIRAFGRRIRIARRQERTSRTSAMSPAAANYKCCSVFSSSAITSDISPMRDFRLDSPSRHTPALCRVASRAVAG